MSEQHSGNSVPKRSRNLLMLISANLARGRYNIVSQLLEDARRSRVSARQVYEIMLQSYLFLGYPKAIEGLKLFREHYPRFKSPKIEPIDGNVIKLWQKRGEELCRTIYDSNYEPLRKRIHGLSPDLDEWIVWEAYGKVLSRAGVPSIVREFCACSALLITGDIVQLHSHMRGAIYSGASVGMLQEMIDLLEGTAKAEQCRKAVGLLDIIAQKVGKDA